MSASTFKILFYLRKNYLNKEECTVFTMEKFTIPEDKCIVVELHEKSGGRHQLFIIENEDIVHAKVFNELKVKEWEKHFY